MSVTVAPSMLHCLFAPLPKALYPSIWPELRPPTLFTAITRPGVCSITTQGSRAVGMASRSSRPKFTPSAVDFVSTTGLAPVMVTVSWTVDRLSLMLSSTFRPAWMMMPSRTTRLNPGSSKLIV